MLFRNNLKFSNWQNGFTTCFKVVLFILLLTTFLPVFAQTPTTPPPAENSEESDSIDVIGISSKDMGTTLMDTAQLRALKDTLRWKLNQFFDIDMLEKCLEVRAISNLSGFSLLSKNKSLSDTVNLFEKNYQTNIFINSFVNSGQLWPRLIFNPNKTTNYIADSKNKPAIGFDIRFTPKGTIGNRVFNVDIQNHATDGILDSTKQNILKDVTNQSLINKQFTNIKPNGRDTVNNAMYKGFASLRGMFAQKISQNNISQVTFEPCSSQGYGFDVYPHLAIQSYYDEIDVNGHNYDVPWKSVSTTGGDSVKVTINLRDKNAANHVVKFRSPITTMVVKPTGTNKYVISFPGGIENSEQAIEAYYVDSTVSEVPKEFIIGKLKIHSYAPITKKLTPVILNGASFSIDKSELEKYLNNIYKQSAVTWIVNDPIYKTVKNWDMDDDKTIFLTTPYSHYSDEMQTIIDGIVDTPDPEINYIIITDIQNIYNYTECMPLKSQFGFLFTKNLGTVNEGAGSGNKGYHMIAHELGHGAFSLKHIEDDYKILDASDNLMNNYTMGKAFWKPQWDAIQNGVNLQTKQITENGDSTALDDRITKKIKKWYYFTINDDTTNKYYDSQDINTIIQTKNSIIRIKSDSTALNQDSLTWSINGNIISAKSLNCEVLVNKKGNKKVVVELTILKKKYKLTLNIVVYKKPVIKFKTNSYTGAFGFDSKNDNEISCTYNSIKIDENDYYIPYISAQIGTNINLYLDCSIPNKAINDKKFFVKIATSQNLVTFSDLKDKYLANELNSNKLLTVIAGSIEGVDTIKITDNTNSIIGMAIIYIGKNDPPLKLIPIYIVTDSKNEIDINKVTDQLNNYSYNQVFKQWDVSPPLTWNISKNPKWKNNKSLYFPTGAISLNTLKNIYEIDSLKTFGANDYIVFITDLDLPKDENGSLAGRASDLYGHYVIICKPASKVTFTHELGHCLGLHHIDESDFKKDNSCNKYFSNAVSTKNFMSYSTTRNMFWHFQWKILKFKF